MPDKELMNDILGRIHPGLEDELSSMVVEALRIGTVYTGVKLTGGYAGIAATQPSSTSTHCDTLPNAGNFTGTPVPDMLEMALSDNPLYTVVGLSVINALSGRLCEKQGLSYSGTDILELIEPGDTVGMVGHFSPLLPKILKITPNINILEKKDIQDKRVNIIDTSRASDILPDSDVLIITASSLVNDSTEELMAMKGRAREMVLLGPSTPLLPGPFFDRGFTAVMGTYIHDPQSMLDIVSQAGGTKHIHKKAGKKVSFVKNG